MMNLPDQQLLPAQAESLPRQPDAGTATAAAAGNGARAGHAEPAVRVAELPEPWRSAAVTVVLPTYQEADNIRLIADALLRLPLPNLRILVADDNSPDGTGRIADDLAREHEDRITVVH
ncbi:MAG: glycosyltransferase, partial [Streptosporangiales bacterium]|nr:glycosyltransferase [Streptosporangiales bacterium]